MGGDLGFDVLGDVAALLTLRALDDDVENCVRTGGGMLGKPRREDGRGWYADRLGLRRRDAGQRGESAGRCDERTRHALRFHDDIAYDDVYNGLVVDSADGVRRARWGGGGRRRSGSARAGPPRRS